jgi:hypothetical protein
VAREDERRTPCDVAAAVRTDVLELDSDLGVSEDDSPVRLLPDREIGDEEASAGLATTEVEAS